MRKKRFFTFFYIIFMMPFSYAHEFEIDLDENIYNKEKNKIFAHRNYLSIDINYNPIKEIYRSIESELKLKLKNRGEAHITVITPIEYSRVLSKKLTIKELNRLAIGDGLGSTDYNIVCLGRGIKKIKGKSEMNFFLVIESQGLTSYRRKVKELFIEKGGERDAFLADHYFPHITVGFTKKDLHEKDGVIKNYKSCYAKTNINE